MLQWQCKLIENLYKPYTLKISNKNESSWIQTKFLLSDHGSFNLFFYTAHIYTIVSKASPYPDASKGCRPAKIFRKKPDPKTAVRVRKVHFRICNGMEQKTTNQKNTGSGPMAAGHTRHTKAHENNPPNYVRNMVLCVASQLRHVGLFECELRSSTIAPVASVRKCYTVGGTAGKESSVPAARGGRRRLCQTFYHKSVFRSSNHRATEL